MLFSALIVSLGYLWSHLPLSRMKTKRALFVMSRDWLCIHDLQTNQQQQQQSKLVNKETKDC